MGGCGSKNLPRGTKGAPAIDPATSRQDDSIPIRGSSGRGIAQFAPLNDDKGVEPPRRCLQRRPPPRGVLPQSSLLPKRQTLVICNIDFESAEMKKGHLVCL